MKSKLPVEWEEVRLKDITQKIGSGATPRGGSKVYIDEGISLIRSQNVLDFSFTEEGLVHIDEDAAEKLSNVEVFEKDILINITGDSVARTCLVPIDMLPARVNQHVSIIRVDESLADYKYISYKLHDLKRLLLSYSNSGGTRKALTKSMLEDLEFNLPLLKEQQKIANTLSALDNKIKNNNKINENLEQQAQEIFKHWFVDFEFPNENGEPYKSSGGEMVESELGIIPKGWEVKELLEVMDFQGGSQPPKKEHLYEEKEGYIRFIQNRDYAENPKHLTYIPVSTRNKLANKYDILIDKYGEAGKTRYGIAGAYNVALAKVEPKNIENREYIRRFLEQKNIVTYLYNASIASTRPSLNRSTFTGLKFAMPTYDVEKEFNDFSLNIIDIILKNKEENRKLARLRDTLLPKLMSGELRIPLDE